MSAPTSNSRTWHQLSLRQLFVLVSLAAICLVVWRYSTKAQRSARALEQVGCRIGFEGGGGGWLEQLVGKATLLPVNAVVGDHTKFDDADARLVGGMSKLRILSLANTRITDEGLAELRGLNSLTTLNLERTKISDDGLRHIAQFRKLKSLNLAGTAISEAGLAHLARLRELVHLDLSETRIGAEHPESLATFGALVMLSLSKTQVRGDLSFLEKVPRLSELKLDHTLVTDSCVPALGRVRDLHFVDLRGTQVSPEGQRKLHSVRQKMVIVTDWGVTNAGP
jgi:hypothetical protein